MRRTHLPFSSHNRGNLGLRGHRGESAQHKRFVHRNTTRDFPAIPTASVRATRTAHLKCFVLLALSPTLPPETPRTLLFVLLATFLTPLRAAHDDVVYGETLAGISAAISAARAGKSVVLLSTTTHLGGVATAGLTATDMNRSPVIGGIAREFYGHLYDH